MFLQLAHPATRLLPPQEPFNLIQQIRRAALSVHLNIAEGSSHKSEPERKRFYEITRGSVVEIDAAFDITSDLGYLQMEQLTNFRENMTKCFKILSKLISG